MRGNFVLRILKINKCARPDHSSDLMTKGCAHSRCARGELVEPYECSNPSTGLRLRHGFDAHAGRALIEKIVFLFGLLCCFFLCTSYLFKDETHQRKRVRE